MTNHRPLFFLQKVSPVSYLHSSPHVCQRTQSKLCKGSNGLLKSPSLKIISGTSFLEEVRRQLWDKSGIILHRCMVSVCNA
ncbi:unnamed protein product [Brassica napus]|nr:unnamed protein product [Brassica napus]